METTPNYQLVNLMLYFVEHRIDEVIETCDACRCEKCRMDMMALALNKLPSKYVVTVHDQLIDLTFRKSGAEILTALTQAVLLVKENPKH